MQVMRGSKIDLLPAVHYILGNIGDLQELV